MAVMVPDEIKKYYWLVVRFCIAESGVNCRPAHCLFLCPTTKLAREKAMRTEVERNHLVVSAVFVF